ncbi:MAG TPA: hypothetical protein PKB10_10095 [Tepidisphaeraceae bacterium]|nr:hypothetical protein [Tepidisphaeraceae bacterium]
MKDRAALEYGAAGVVVIVDHADAAPPTDGEPVLLVRADGWFYRGRAEDVRVEPSARATGLFLRDLHADDVPIGSKLTWGAEVRVVENAVA